MLHWERSIVSEVLPATSAECVALQAADCAAAMGQKTVADGSRPSRCRPSRSADYRAGVTMADEFNGVPCDKMFGTIAKIRENSELARFPLLSEERLD